MHLGDQGEHTGVRGSMHGLAHREHWGEPCRGGRNPGDCCILFGSGVQNGQGAATREEESEDA
jgi:hypothetical protein